MVKNFSEHFTALVDTLWKIVNEVSEDRREWMKLKVGNSLMFGSASSFFFHKVAPKRNEASLNEAIACRTAALAFYEGNDERLASDIESIERYYSPKPPIAIDRKKVKDEKVPAAVTKRLKALADRAKQQNETRSRIQPDLKGFLDGAKYDPFDLQPSEQAGERALNVATRAMSAMQERVEQDLLHCAGKWQEAWDAGDDTRKTYWEAELLFAEVDEKWLKDAAKQYNLEVSSQ